MLAPNVKYILHLKKRSYRKNGKCGPCTSVDILIVFSISKQINNSLLNGISRAPVSICCKMLRNIFCFPLSAEQISCFHHTLHGMPATIFHGNYLIVARLQHITFYVLSIGMQGQGWWGGNERLRGWEIYFNLHWRWQQSFKKKLWRNIVIVMAWTM